MGSCPNCTQDELCKRHRFLQGAIGTVTPALKTHFSGKSSPEVFVGRIGYPLINSGILAPVENDLIAGFGNAESWSANNFSIENVLRARSQLVYGRYKTHIKLSNSLKQVSQELALSSKPVSVEVFLKKKPTIDFSLDSIYRPVVNPAPLTRAILEENPSVLSKVDYLTQDYDCSATTALSELFKSGVPVDHLQKLLSIGHLGVRASRKMVPTRWSITATDDTLSKALLTKIREYKELDTFLVFSGNFVGNYIEILLMPGSFSFEGIEAWLEDEKPFDSVVFAQDNEGFFGRKKYAINVTGGYYAMRLPVTEYLEKIKRQARVLVYREITSEYHTPLGVGVVRECTRRALRNAMRRFDSLDEALLDISKRMRVSLEKLRRESRILNEVGRQKTINDWF